MEFSPFSTYFTYITAASVPVYALNEFFLPVVCKICKQVTAPPHITVIETMVRGERRTNPITMTVISSQKEMGHAMDLAYNLFFSSLVFHQQC